jgi:L-2-hydroxyglutarate oxidase LhgO
VSANGSDSVCVVGAGILGLAVAREVTRRRPGARVTVLDKEQDLATHQTGRNSGVVHAGLYYEPGSLKATLCRRGSALLREYCAEHAIAYEAVGKVVVASREDELPRLDRIEQRARANGVPDLARVGPEGLRELEPHTVGVAALHSPHTATADFRGVCRRLAQDVREAGGEVLFGQQVLDVREAGDGVTVTLAGGERTFGSVVVCAGLGGDRLARDMGRGRDLRIVPFRGEYWRLVGPARDRVVGMVYPVPDPRYPFLGVHLTRRFDGEVLVGPNAVMALAKEGYRWRDVAPRDLAELAAWSGTWRLARRHWRTGVREMSVSLSKRAFLNAARQYMPGLESADLARAQAGVRAQAVARDGSLLDDFVIDVSGGVVAVRNAPSPAATSSLAIAEYVADRVPALQAH